MSGIELDVFPESDDVDIELPESFVFHGFTYCNSKIAALNKFAKYVYNRECFAYYTQFRRYNYFTNNFMLILD